MAIKSLLLLASLLLFLAFQQFIISQFKQLPSPLYGGDLYFQLGSINHIRYGGNPLEASNLLDSEPAYFVLYGFLVASFANFFRLDSIQAMFYFSQLLLLASLILAFLVFRRICGDDLLATLCAFAYVNPIQFPVLMYTRFTYVLIVPLLILAAYEFALRPILRNSLLFGVVVGLGLLSHGSMSMVSGLLFLTVLVFLLAEMRLLSLSVEARSVVVRFQRKNLNLVALLGFFVALLVASGIGLLYWFKPIFVYRGTTLNDSQLWSFPDYGNPKCAANYVLGVVRDVFGLRADPYHLVVCATTLLALLNLTLLLVKKHNVLNKTFLFICLFFLASLLGALHPVLTTSLFGTHFTERVGLFMLPMAKFMLIACLLSRFVLFSERLKRLGFLILFCLLIGSQLYALGPKQFEPWYDWAKHNLRDLSPHLAEASDWILKNTGVNDVFLTTKEVGFAINALTGRKVVMSRRAQNSPFLDVETREMELAAILYGNDTQLRRELLRKHRVRYLYWDQFWVSSEYSFNVVWENIPQRHPESAVIILELSQRGLLSGCVGIPNCVGRGTYIHYFDPVLLKHTETSEEALQRLGIPYARIRGWVDPAMRGECFRIYNLLLVTPPYRSLEKPWHVGLDEFIREVWSYKIGNTTAARIYEVVL